MKVNFLTDLYIFISHQLFSVSLREHRRIPFLSGILVGCIGLKMQHGVEDSPEFLELRRTGQLSTLTFILPVLSLPCCCVHSSIIETRSNIVVRPLLTLRGDMHLFFFFLFLLIHLIFRHLTIFWFTASSKTSWSCWCRCCYMVLSNIYGFCVASRVHAGCRDAACCRCPCH